MTTVRAWSGIVVFLAQVVAIDAIIFHAVGAPVEHPGAWFAVAVILAGPAWFVAKAATRPIRE